MTNIKRFLSMLAVVALVGCGDSENAGTPPFGPDTPTPTPSATVADLVVVLASDTIPNDPTANVAVTATAVDSSRAAVAGATIMLSADAEAVVTLTSDSNVTGATGTVTGVVGIGSNRTNRVINVTATSGGITKSAVLTVVTSPGAAQPASIDLISSSSTVKTGGEQVTLQAFVKDSSNNAMPGAPVTFSTDTGTLSGASTLTNSAGVATANFAAGSDRSNRDAHITVASGTQQQSLTLQITGTKLTASGPQSFIQGGSGPYAIQVVDSNGNPIPNVAVSGTSTLGNALTASGSGTTDSTGSASFTYQATNPGSDEVTFSAAGFSAAPIEVNVSADDFAFVSPAPGTEVVVGVEKELVVELKQGGEPARGKRIDFTTTGGTLVPTSTAPDSRTTDDQGHARVKLTSSSAGPVTVQATAVDSQTTTTLSLVIVAKDPANLVLQVSPTAIAPNAQTTVLAKVTDSAGNPVAGVTVNFSRDVDPSGGNLVTPSAPTDANGQASVQYKAGPESTASNGVLLRGAVASNSAVTGTAPLTVSQAALFITLGTGNVVGNIDPQTYKKDWVVYVTDANGVAVSGVNLTIKALPLHYLRGRLMWSGVTWIYEPQILTCPNEDVNSNGILDREDVNGNDILDPGEDTNGNGVLDNEDTNRDGVLWPGNVVAVSPGTVTTDASGRATLSLIYGESYAPWVNLRLTASAIVTGTESKRDADFVIPGSAADFSDEKVPPAGVVSPFGTYRSTCTP